MTKQNNKTIFISHATVDAHLHHCFFDLFVNGFGMKKDAIFSSSIARNMKTNNNFMEVIKKNIQECDVIVLLITSSYMRKPFCLAELGAAWGLGKRIVPIVLETVTVSDYNRTPLQGMQFRRLTELDVVYDEFKDIGLISESNTKEFNQHYQIFLQKIKFAEQSGNQFIATIVQDRAEMDCNSNLQGKRCLKLNALVPLETPPVDGETHWLFFDDDERYGNPKVGDMVKFHVSGSKFYAKPWGDGLENTRNIYPKSKIEILN